MSSANNKVEHFLSSPLVAWIKTFDDLNLVETVDDLADGILLNKAMYTVDPSSYPMTKVNRSVSREPSLRMQNLQLLTRNIKHFYLTQLQQLVITGLPNITHIAHCPETDYSMDQLEKILVLLLGCVVQCDNKVPLIEQMKKMDLNQQQALVMYIKQVTDSTDYVCSIDWNDLADISKQNLEGLCRTAYLHLQKVAKERDNQYESGVDITMERDYYKQLHETGNPNESLPHENGLPLGTPSPAKSPAVNPEMIELKKRCRHLQEQLDRKNEVMTDLKEDLEHARATIKQLQQEKKELAEDAKLARVYRDEIETLKVQSAKVEKLEADVVKYRQKAEDTEYLRKRIADLKQQNELMLETKSLLEQKADSLQSRSDALDELQEVHASLKVQVESFSLEKEVDMERIEELLAQNTRMELELKHFEEQVSQLTKELNTERERVSLSEANTSGEASNLSFEMSEADLASKAKVLRLEKEAQEMEKSMEALRHAQAKCSELEKTNKKLYSQTHSDRKEIIKLREEVEVFKVKASRVDKLQVELNSQRERLEEANRTSAKLKEMKSRSEIILEAKAKLEDEVESLQSKVTQLGQLRDENASMKAQLDSVTSKREEDERSVQELLEQNAQLELEKQRMSEEREALNAELIQLRSRSGPQAPVTVLSPPRISEGEMASRAKLQRLEKETREMEKSMEALRHAQAKSSELEKTNKKLQEHALTGRKEIARLKEELQVFKTKSQKVERLQSEMKSQEQQMEDIDGAKKKITELKQQNALLSQTKALLQEEVNSLQSKVEKLAKLQAENAALSVQVESLEKENEEENVHMQELLQQNVHLELDRDNKNVELESLNNEIAQLKLKLASKPVPSSVSPVHKPMTEQDIEAQTKLLRLERDNRELELSLQVAKQTSDRVSAEMEKTSRRLTAQIHADKKEIARLKEELRRERSQHAGLTRLRSVSEDQDQQQTKQLQELEGKFKDAYSQSLSNKDERIQVLEKRIDETTVDNNQLREDLASMKKQYEKLKELVQASGESPHSSPSLKRMNSPRELSRLREQAADAIKLRDKLHRVQEDNTHLTSDLLEARDILLKHETTNQRLQDRIQMLDQLNSTLEEEKRTLLGQINKLLEQNQSILVRTLESKDQALEDERIFNDRLGELERDKVRLTEQLVAQQREHLAKEIDYYKKSNKSKNLLKKGFKKLKGKIQGRSHVFEMPDGTTVGYPSSHTLSAGSPSGGSYGLGMPLYMQDGSMSSSQSISSSNSEKQSEDIEDNMEPLDSGAGASALVPRAPTAEGSPFLRQKKSRSYTLPGIGPVKLRHGPVASPSMEPDRSDNLLSLEDFLAEANKTPNRRKVMELKRASLIQNTPPSTPRNSMLLVPSQTAGSNSSQMFNLQEFLTRFDQEDTPGMIREMEETESQQHLRSRLRSSQQSVSQVSNRSKSSSSLQSAPSTTSMSRENLEHQHMPVIANPAAMANMNSNNSNNNNSNDMGSQESAPIVATTNYNGSATLVEGGERSANDNGIGPNSSTPNWPKAVGVTQGQEIHSSVISWGDASSISIGSRSLSSNSTGDVRFSQGTGSQPQLIGTTHDMNYAWKPRSYSTSAAGSETNLDIPRSTSSEGLKKPEKAKSKGRSLFKRHFHRSSDNILEEPKAQGNARKPPLIQRKFHKSEFDLVDRKRKTEGGKKRVDFSEAERGVTDALSLSRLTDLRHRGEMSNVSIPAQQRKKTKNTGRRSLQPKSIVPSGSHEHLQEETESGSDELLSLTDILSELDPGSHPKSAPAPQSHSIPPPSPRSPGQDSIWQEYGCV